MSVLSVSQRNTQLAVVIVCTIQELTHGLSTSTEHPDRHMSPLSLNLEVEKTLSRGNCLFVLLHERQSQLENQKAPVSLSHLHDSQTLMMGVVVVRGAVDPVSKSRSIMVWLAVPRLLSEVPVPICLSRRLCR